MGNGGGPATLPGMEYNPDGFESQNEKAFQAMHRSCQILIIVPLLVLLASCHSSKTSDKHGGSSPMESAAKNSNQVATVILKIDGFMKSKSGAT